VLVAVVVLVLRWFVVSGVVVRFGACSSFLSRCKQQTQQNTKKVDCEAAGRGGEAFPECRCAPTFMKRAPSCFAGDAAHARMRMRHQLSIPEYEAFLDFMCPTSSLDDNAGGGSGGDSSGGGGGGASLASNSRQQQQWRRRRQPWPPAGSDPRECPRPVLGTYDDHDSGWNNGDARNPQLAAIKNVYLDGLGEPQGSARRSAARGIEASYTFYSESDDGGDGSGGGGGGTIDVVLLDERYYRWVTLLVTNGAVTVAHGAF
jgi:alkaline phosphatase D